MFDSYSLFAYNRLRSQMQVGPYVAGPSGIYHSGCHISLDAADSLGGAMEALGQLHRRLKSPEGNPLLSLNGARSAYFLIPPRDVERR
jgi:hypothetical protein